MVAMLRGDLCRRLALLVDGGRDGAVLEKRLRDLHVAEPRRAMQRRDAQLLRDIRRGPLRGEDRSYFGCITLPSRIE